LINTYYIIGGISGIAICRILWIYEELPTTAYNYNIILIYNMDKVAILIPCYNEDIKYLHECIDSALNINYNNKEIIILDDGSSDLSVYDKYLDKSNIYILSQINHKLPQTLHNLFHLTQKYDYITWGSSDNIWGPEFLNKHLDAIKNNNADITYSSYYLIDEESNFLESSSYRKHEKDRLICENKIFIQPPDLNLIQYLNKLLFEGDNFIGASFLIKKNTFISYCNLDGIEDYVYWVSCLSKKHKFHCIETNEILYKYRIHEKSATSIMMNSMVTDGKMIMLKKHLFSLYIQQQLLWDYRKIYDYSLINFNKFIYNMGVSDFDTLLLNIGTKYGTPGIDTINNHDLENIHVIKTILPLLVNKDKNIILKRLFKPEIICEFIPPRIITMNKINVLLITQKFGFGGLENIMKINSRSSISFNVTIGSFENSDNTDIVNFNSSVKNIIDYVNVNNISIIDFHYTLFNINEIRNETTCKLVFTNHNSYFWLDKGSREIIKNNDIYIDAYVNVSQNVKNTSVEIFKNDVSKSYIINNGVDFNDIAKNTTSEDNYDSIRNFDKKILCMASIIPDKGQFELVCAFKTFLKSYPNSVLILLGKKVDKNYVNKILGFIDINNLSKHIILTECSHNQVINYINLADICVLTSFVEGCSQSIKEWIYHNKRIIVTNVGSNLYLQEKFKNIIIVPVPFSIYDINTQEKYFEFLFNNDKTEFIKSIEHALCNNINMEIDINNNLSLITSDYMNQNKEILYYALLKNNYTMLEIFK